MLGVLAAYQTTNLGVMVPIKGLPLLLSFFRRKKVKPLICANAKPLETQVFATVPTKMFKVFGQSNNPLCRIC